MMDSCYLMLDVGGTGIKAGLFSRGGQMIDQVCSFPAKAKEGRGDIFRNFACIIQAMAGDRLVEGIGMAFPGPFDYQKGISLMQGLDKYDSIYGVSVRAGVMQELEKIGGIRNVPRDCRFLFLHDVEAFAIGACINGGASGCEKVLCVCVGTGAGSAFVENRHVIKEPGGGVPVNGWIYNTPFKEGVIDDYVSVRGLRSLTESVFAQPETVDGAKLFELAEAGSEQALKVFAAFGEDLSEALLPFLKAFRPQGLVLGGQIAKSLPYFGGPLRDACRHLGCAVFTEPDTSVRAMEGLYAAWRIE